MEAPSTVEPSRSRPRERRAQIAENASELFSARGFHTVRMDDIAAASGITARALYRHYQSKVDLLSHVLREGQRHVVDTLVDLSSQPAEERSVDTNLVRITNAALDSRRLSLLWQREARHLSDDDYELVRNQTRWISQKFRELLIDPRRSDLDPAVANLRAWAVVSLVSGPGIYDSSLSRLRLSQALVAAAARVIDAPVQSYEESHRHGVDRGSASRREQLLSTAARAFREKGFAGVSLDDIGTQLGIAGPALYRYFDNKADLLVTAISRHQEWLALELTRAMNAPVPDAAVIALVVKGYIRIALEATDFLAVALTEWLYLPANVIERFVRVRTDYIAEWQRWMLAARPDLSEAQAETLVNATKTMIDDCVRIPHIHRDRRLNRELESAAFAILATQ